MHFLIVGNSAAGIFAAEAIRKSDERSRIDILSDELYPAYARCLTSYYLSGSLENEKMMIRPPDYYKRNNLNLFLGEKVVKVDHTEKEIYTHTGKKFCYDKLLLATGASPVMPELPGIGSKGVFTLRTMDDAKGILHYAVPGKHAVVAGGGFVSLKAAYALLKRGLSVTVVVSSGYLLSQMLDHNAAKIVEKVLISHGLNIKYYVDVTAVSEKTDGYSGGTLESVHLSNGEELPADLLIVGKGVIPNVNFLAGSGIEVNNGILVNEYLQTNIPDIYSAGDVALGYDLVTGRRRINAIWPNAAEQGFIAGKNMAGLSVPYSGSIGMNSVDFFGLSVIAAGWTKGEQGENCEVASFQSGENEYRKLIFLNDTLAGYILVGKTAHSGVLTALIREKIPLGKSKDVLSEGHFRQKLLW